MRSYSNTDSKGRFLDRRLDDIFGQKERGYFIELGANDGLTQSNTAFFEKSRGWRGVLIEPSLSAYKMCLTRRPKSRCFHCACVGPDFEGTTVRGDFNGHLMNSINGTRLGSAASVSVRARTLESVLDEAGAPAAPDFLSLDCEGAELDILRGMNLERYRPHYMLIEVYNNQYDELVAFLAANNYRLVCNFSEYNRTDNPFWDGTHNDYLFLDERRLV